MPGAIPPLLDRLAILRAKPLAVSKKPRDEPVEQGPKLREIVFQRRARQRNALPRLDLPNVPGHGSGGILHRLSLVQNGEFVFVGKERLVVPMDQGVCCQDQVMCPDLIEPLMTLGSMQAKDFQVGRKACRLVQPVADQAGGNHQQARVLGLPFDMTVEQEGQGLHGLSKAHVVGQDASKPAFAQGLEPAIALRLIWTKLGLQRGRLVFP